MYSRNRRRVLSVFEIREDWTCDEIEDRLGMLHQSASATLHHLERDLVVYKTRETRPTRSGCSAKIYRLRKSWVDNEKKQLTLFD